MLEDETEKSGNVAYPLHSVKAVDCVRTNTPIDSMRRTEPGITWGSPIVAGSTENKPDFSDEIQLVPIHFAPSLALDMDQQDAYHHHSFSSQNETRKTAPFVSLEASVTKNEESVSAHSNGTADLLQHIQNESERSKARIELIKKLRNLKARSYCSPATQCSSHALHPIDCMTSTNSTGTCRARFEIISKLRYLKARREGIESTHHKVTSGLECGTVAVESSELFESSSGITNSSVNPRNSVCVEFSASYYRAAARIERERANKFLVELARAKADILRLSKPEEAPEKYNRKGLRQEERLAVSWTSRFWNKCRPHDGIIAGKYAEAWNSTIASRGDNRTEMTDQCADPCKHPPSGSTKCDGNVKETRQILEELMQIMNSLSVCRDLSVQLDLRPGVNGWSVNSIFVDRVVKSSDYGEI